MNGPQGDMRADVIIVGSGPAGIAATQAATQAGLHVLVLDEQAQAGGQVWRNAERLSDTTGSLSRSYKGAGEALKALAHRAVTYAPGATVIDASASESGVTVTWLASQSDQPRHIVESAGRALIIATGAQERSVAFPGGELAGVMGIGAVQTAMKQSGLVPGGPGAVLAGQGPLLLLTLTQILTLGGHVEAVLDWSPPGALARALPHLPAALAGDAALMAEGMRLLAETRGKVRHYRAVSELRAEGDNHIEHINFRSQGEAVSLPCTLLAVHDGVIPNTQLTRLLDLPHQWNDIQAAFQPIVDDAGRAGALPVWVAGDGAGIAGAKVASLRGQLAGMDAAQALGVAAGDGRTRTLKNTVKTRIRARRFVDALYTPLPADAHANADTQICRCEAVTLAQIKSAVSDGAHGPNRVKAFTRCGMGPCQGRMCGNLLTRLIAAETGIAPDEVGALRIRPPLKPVLVRDYMPQDALPEAAQ